MNIKNSMASTLPCAHCFTFMMGVATAMAVNKINRQSSRATVSIEPMFNKGKIRAPAQSVNSANVLSH